jgi:hypothetical protein
LGERLKTEEVKERMEDLEELRGGSGAGRGNW